MCTSVHSRSHLSLQHHRGGDAGGDGSAGDTGFARAGGQHGPCMGRAQQKAGADGTGEWALISVFGSHSGAFPPLSETSLTFQNTSESGAGRPQRNGAHGTETTKEKLSSAFPCCVATLGTLA